MSKVDRAVYGPSWTEVILGAFLSLLLGLLIGVALLVFRPVVVAKDEPKEREKNTVYYIEGSREGSKSRQALAKRSALLGGQSVSVTEEEINSLLTPSGSAATKQPEKGKKAADGEKKADAPVGTDGMYAVGAPNVRIRDNAFQVAAPVTINLLDHTIIAQARGGFVKQGESFVFEPEEIYLGSCPVQRVPVLAGLLRDKILAAQALPPDIQGAWQKLAGVRVEGNVLKLTMP